MKQQIQTLHAEFIKLKHSKIVWITFIAFSIAPIMGALLIPIIQDSASSANTGALAAKAKAMNLEANWESYLDILTQAVGVGGIMIFGFVISWIFGREYSDGTAKDLLSLPTSRTKILNAKFLLFILWCSLLAISNLLLAFILGKLIQLPPTDTRSLVQPLSDYLITTALTIIVMVPVAFFTLWGKGYLAPLGFVALILVFAQVIAATGYGTYFPWSVPGLYSGVGGEFKVLLNNFSYGILILTGIFGYIATIKYWNYTDQTQ
ncbi:MAG: bacitracin ABC transporter permease [Flavobacteriales bacterium]|nr:MAG: bacitracin ABC transporter permease [Flavobacteriales bacterium]